MTAGEWATCNDPRPMLDQIGHRATDRKLRLFLTACCRRIWPLLQDERCRRAVEVAERFADGHANREALEAAHEAALAARAAGAPGAPANATATYLEPARGRLGYDRERPVMLDVHEGASRAASCWANAKSQIEGSNWSELMRNERRFQCALLRDLFRPPSHLFAIQEAWRSSTVVALARQMDASNDFSALPILTEAIQDAGCENSDILSHCRGNGPHIRGCWVVDLLLGKE